MLRDVLLLRSLSAAAAAFVLPAAACVAAASTLFVESIPYFLPEPDANLMWPDRIGPLGVTESPDVTKVGDIISYSVPMRIDMQQADVYIYIYPSIEPTLF